MEIPPVYSADNISIRSLHHGRQGATGRAASIKGSHNNCSMSGDISASLVDSAATEPTSCTDITGVL